MDELRNEQTGYGLIYQSLTRNKEIDIEAKGLFAYLSSFAGTSNVAFPSVSLICHELNISERRYLKYKRQLEEHGHIKVERKRTDNGFSKNIYTLVHNIVSSQNVPIQNVRIQNVRVQNVPVQNDGTNINSIKNNSIKNNSVVIHHDLFKTILNLYQENIEMTPSQITLQKIGQDFDDYGYELMKHAIEKSALANNHDYRFIAYLLKDWNKNQLKTVEAVKQYEAQREAKKNYSNNRGQTATVSPYANMEFIEPDENDLPF